MSVFYHALMTFLLKMLHFMVDMVFPPRATALQVRAASLPALAALCEPRLIQITNQLHVTALLPYHAPLVQALIIEAKYENNRKAQELLGTLLSNYIKEWCKEHGEERVAVIPVPLSPKRRKTRGYNQVEVVARFAAQSGLITLLTDALIRTRETAPQTSLGQEARLQNMTGAFGAGPFLPTYFDSSPTYFLLDDVLTTGATLSAARSALQNVVEKHGSQSARPDIVLLTLAH